MSHNQPLRLERIFQAYNPPLYFVTLCAAERRRLFNTAEVHDAFVNYCRRALDHNITVGRYVLMPDHIHFFVQGGLSFDLGLWIRGLKRVVAAAVSGGRSVLLVTFTPGRSRRFHLGDSIRRSSSPSQLGRDFLERNPTSAHNFLYCG